MPSKLTFVAAIALASAPQLAHAVSPQPASTPTSAAAAVTTVPGLGIANLESVIAGSTAFKAAQKQRAVTFKTELEQAANRRQQINGQLQAMVDKLTKDRAATKMAPATFQQRTAEIQAAQSGGNQELAGIVKAVALSDTYVREQIAAKLPSCLTAAMAKHGISVLIGPNDVLVSTAANSLDAAIIQELDAALPSVQLVPPAGWAPKKADTAASS
jgi:Skp family chaperone for outer membrane proteins